MLLADDCLEQNISDMLASDKYPTMLVLSAVVTAVGAVLALKKLIGIMHEKNTSQEPGNRSSPTPQLPLIFTGQAFPLLRSAKRRSAGIAGIQYR